MHDPRLLVQTAQFPSSPPLTHGTVVIRGIIPRKAFLMIKMPAEEGIPIRQLNFLPTPSLDFADNHPVPTKPSALPLPTVPSNAPTEDSPISRICAGVEYTLTEGTLARLKTKTPTLSENLCSGPKVVLRPTQHLISTKARQLVLAT